MNAPTKDQSYCDVGQHQQCSGYTEDESDPETCMCDCHTETEQVDLLGALSRSIGEARQRRRHLDQCPMARPWLYNLDEDIECTCADLRAGDAL